MSTKGKAESFVRLRGSLYMPDAIVGKSAYEIALIHGFEGTEEEWLASLKGKDGAMSFNDLTEEQKESLRGVPSVTAADNGKLLQVVNGVWTAVSIPYAEEVSV